MTGTIDWAARSLKKTFSLPAALLRRYETIFKVALCFSLLNLLPTKHWLQEINRNLGGYYLGMHALSLVLAALAFRQFRAGAIFLAANALMFWYYLTPLLPFLLKRPALRTAEAAVAAHERKLRIFYANVHGPNERYAETAAEIARHSPDLVALLELTPAWSQALQLENAYPYHITVLRNDNYGLGVFSRYPLEVVLTDVGDDSVPVIYGKLLYPDAEPIALFLIHAMPPASTEEYVSSRILLRRISTLLRHGAEEALVLGDFNATPFSDSYERFKRGSRLGDAMEGFGLLRSWNAQHSFLRLTLDHLFYRGRMRVDSFTTLPPGGSDHFPYLVDLRLLKAG